MRWLAPLCLVLLAAGLSRTAAAADLEAATSQVAAGACGLALDTLATKSPEPGQPEWERWARLRVRAWREQGRPEKVVAAAEAVPDPAPGEYRRWVASQAARVELDR
ncbi:MAG TPA: hypothetical protein VKA48_11690, partial [Gammaproteobacteria bacterium]|nr:hypothetical protein [Gammaproteobacteria bacterium]